MRWEEDGPCNQTDLPPISRFSSSALSCSRWPPQTHAATAQPSSQPSPADSCLTRVLSRKRLPVVSTMIMVRIYQSTPSDFQAILVGGLCPGAEDVAQCEANLPEFWGMIAALLWPGYWDPSVGLAAHLHTVFTFKCGKENRKLGLVPQFGHMCILCCKKMPFGDLAGSTKIFHIF